MLNFDVTRFVKIQSGAVGLAENIDGLIASALAKGAENIFFLGTGGAAILMQPAAQLLARHSRFPVFLDMSAELVLGGSPQLGEHSVVVIPSLSGTTEESIAVAELCKSRGALLIALVGHDNTKLTKIADHSLVNFAEDDTSCESFYLQSLLVALSVMHHRAEYPAYTDTVAQLKRLPGLLVEVKRAFEPLAAAVAEHIAASSYHILCGSGATWPQAFYYGMCILEEMQWIRTRPVHASDFFHGTLELVEPGVSIILFKGEDVYRPLTERVEHFAASRTDRMLTLDTKEFVLAGIAEQVRALISPVLLATVLERASAHLEVKRDHPLTTRRYYKRVTY
jgi:fructoselysine-6-phosphate deglycase